MLRKGKLKFGNAQSTHLEDKKNKPSLVAKNALGLRCFLHGTVGRAAPQNTSLQLCKNRSKAETPFSFPFSHPTAPCSCTHSMPWQREALGWTQERIIYIVYSSLVFSLQHSTLVTNIPVSTASQAVLVHLHMLRQRYIWFTGILSIYKRPLVFLFGGMMFKVN